MSNSHEGVRWPIVFLILFGVSVTWAVPFATQVPIDYNVWLLPWYQHILTTGPVHAFSEPFSNYTPPYLYLLSAVSLVGLPAFYAIKSLSVVGAVWMAFAVFRLLRAVGAERPWEAAAWSLMLPTVMFNVPFLMQADAFWVAPCLLAVTAAVRRDAWWMGIWASIAFAFKAQAVFIAPFVAAICVRDRVPIYYWLTPIWVYAVAMLPAWAAGWPALDLLTVYVRQAQWRLGSGPFVSDASNLFLLLGFINHPLAEKLLPLGYLGAAATTIALVRYCGRASPILAASLSAIAIPWLLPGMHERFFILAEVLTFCLAWQLRTPLAIATAVLTQLALNLLLFAMKLWIVPLFYVAVATEAAAGLILVVMMSPAAAFQWYRTPLSRAPPSSA